MKSSRTPHEKAIVQIHNLADSLLNKGEETEDMGLIQIALTLRLYMASAVNGDFEEFVTHVGDFARIKIEQSRREFMNEMMGSTTVAAMDYMSDKTRCN
jgi:hypothetical protein